MASCRLALLVLLCTVVAVQSQRQFPSSQFSSRKTSSSVSSQSSPLGRSTFSRSSVSSSSPGSRSTFSRSSVSSSSPGGRSSASRASTSSFSSRRRLGSGPTQTTSQLSSRAGGFSSGRPSSTRSSSFSSSSSSSSSSRFSSRRKSSRPASKPASPFGSTRTSSFSSLSSSSSSGGRLSSSPFSQRASSTTSVSRPTFGSSRRKTTTSTRQSSSRNSGNSAFNRASTSAFSRGSSRGSNSAFSKASNSAFNRAGNSAFNRASSSAFNRASTSPFARGSSSSRTRSQTRPQTGGSAFRSGASKNSLLKQASTVNFNCPEPDGFFADKSQCDKYIECKEGVAKERTCPDGLMFHPERSYPCVYPVEANCESRSALQSPQPTEGCPRQFATFKAAGDQSCGAFTRCINGRAYPSGCPEGLAFDARTLGCEYADMVEGCDAPAYLGFQCPARQFTPDQAGEFTREPHPSDCTKFYVCVNKEDGSVAPRLQGCPEPSVFDPAKGECNDQPQEVPGCENVFPDAVLAAYQQRSSEEQERRATRLAELRAKLTG